MDSQIRKTTEGLVNQAKLIQNANLKLTEDDEASSVPLKNATRK